MPVQDDYVDLDKHDRLRKAAQQIYPPTKTKWHPKRTLTIRKCDLSGELIMPLATAYRQQVFWGLSNAEMGDELEEKWLTPSAYTFKKLNGTL